MLKVRTSVMNGTLDRDDAVAERWTRRPFRREREHPQVLDGLICPCGTELHLFD